MPRNQPVLSRAGTERAVTYGSGSSAEFELTDKLILAASDSSSTTPRRRCETAEQTSPTPRSS